MNPDPAEIFDIQHIGDTLSDARAWDALRKKDRAWWFAFKHLVKHYILLTNFYDTVPPLASGTERVTAKLDALMPPRCGARTFCLAIKKTICISDAAQHERRAGMKPYSDGWVELVVLKFLASEVDFQ